ncbi:hypothetical protein C1H76_7415 [Elsinoe australis]|uniref:Glutamine amidotransferase domain-containing protein n=1 Tax=Elsinoe australis TaxID=40998 RepID=A0A4U7AR43_9PEZI|nr:hypothetical protein C1H76_7415 [Elsinoe australis]
MQRPLRLAILECDHSLDPDGSLYGGYGGLIRSWLQTHEAFRSSNVECTIWDVEIAQTYPAPGAFDAVVITGSRESARICWFQDDSEAYDKATSVNDPFDWVRKLEQFMQGIVGDGKTKSVGLCFGHQLIAKALGAPTLNMMHADNVLSVPQGTVNIGSTEYCSIQGLYAPNKILTVQAHPEFDRMTMQNVIKVMADHGELDEQARTDAVARNVGGTDADLVLNAIAEFLLGFINSMTSIIQEFDNDGKNEVLLEKSPGLKNQ